MPAFSFFFISSLVAGIFHYAFQVIEGRFLSVADFALVNGWFADLSIFFMASGILQYLANFYPLSSQTLRRRIAALLVLSLVFMVLWPLAGPGPSLQRAGIVWLGSSLFAWVMGQFQVRQLFYTLSIANLILAVSKIVMVSVPLTLQWSFSNDTEPFVFALYANYIPALLWLAYSSLKALPDVQRSTPQLSTPAKAHWIGPLVLSAATALIPQMDLVLSKRLLSSDEFVSIAQASLFYRGIYFTVFIFAQWLLPRQLNKGYPPAQFRFEMYWAAVLILSFAGITSIVSPWIGEWMLKWTTFPPRSLIFWSCLNMALLTGIFLSIQTLCTQLKSKSAAMILLGLLGQMAIETLLARLDLLTGELYFIVACACQLTLLGWASRLLAQAEPNKPQPM